MSNWASVEDIARVYETTVPARTQAVLDTVERKLAQKVPRIAERLGLPSSDPEWLDPDDLLDVLVEATCRKLRNPRGLSSETDGDYGYRIAGVSLVDGWFTAEELSSLRVRPTGSRGPARTLQIGIPDVGRTGQRWENPGADILSEDGRVRVEAP